MLDSLLLASNEAMTKTEMEPSRTLWLEFATAHKSSSSCFVRPFILPRGEDFLRGQAERAQFGAKRRAAESE